MAMDIGSVIRERRTLLGWSQERLATRMGIHKQALSVMEKPGYMPSVRTLVRLGAALEVPAWLMLKEAGE
jgi:transcriptional regulator with XRE-family HTH domain